MDLRGTCKFLRLTVSENDVPLTLSYSLPVDWPLYWNDRAVAAAFIAAGDQIVMTKIL